MGFQHKYNPPDFHAGYIDRRIDQDSAPEDILAHYSSCFDAREASGPPLVLSNDGSLDRRRLCLATVSTAYITLYRIASRRHFQAGAAFPQNWDDSDRKRAAHQRYAPVGTIGHYMGLTFDAAMDECLYYGDGKIDASKNLLVAIECYLDGLLYLGHSNVVESMFRLMGEPLPDDGDDDDPMMKLLDPQTTNALTDRVGLWARTQGFSGIIYPTARYAQRQDVESASRSGGKFRPVVNHITLGTPLDGVLAMDVPRHLLLHRSSGGDLEDWKPIYADLNLVLFSGDQLTGRDRGVFYQAVPLELAELLIREDKRATTETSHFYADAAGHLKPKMRVRTGSQQRIQSMLERSERRDLGQFQVLRPGRGARPAHNLGSAELTPGADGVPWEISLVRAASKLRESGDYRLSEDTFLSVVKSLDEAKRDVSKPIVREVLIEIALSWWRRGNLQQAAELLQFLLDHTPVKHELLNNLGLVYSDQGRLEDAERVLQRAVAMCEEELGKEHPLFIRTLGNHGIALEKLGRIRESIDAHELTLQLAQRLLPPDDVQFTRIMNNLAMSYLQLGRVRRAGALLRQALALTEQLFGSEHLETAMSHHNLGQWCERKDQLEEAEVQYAAAVAIKARAVPESPNLAISLNALASLLHKMGRSEEALPLAEQAYELNLQAFGSAHATTSTSRVLRAVIAMSLRGPVAPGTHSSPTLKTHTKSTPPT